MRYVVTGGAGFIGSHLCEALLRRGDSVVCIDNCSTGNAANVGHLVREPAFKIYIQDVCDPLDVSGGVDGVLHFASAASPKDYFALPVETLRAGSHGTENALVLSEAKDARFVLASTSEVYGDPLVHPQPETYWGNVNPVGPRSVYDEAKRYAEALTAAFHRARDVDTAIVRIFNTYGPRMRAGDGRVVTNFVMQALRGEPLTIYGDGSQTRSFCYVDDEVRGILALLDSDVHDPINIGNPNEFTIAELADVVREVLGVDVPVVYEPLPVDDPTQRRPDISRARELLGWEPAVQLPEGIERMAAYFRRDPSHTAVSI